MWFPTQLFPICSYVDEFLAFMLLPFLLLGYKRLVNKQMFVFCVVLFLFVGLSSSFISGLNQPIMAIVIDLYTFIKLPIVYLYFRELIEQEKAKTVLHILYRIGKVVVVVSFIFCILNYCFNIGMSYDTRYGLRSYKFIYNNPGFFAALMVICYSLINYQDIRYDIKYKILIIFNLFSTLRTVSFGILALLFILSFMVKDRLKIGHITMLIPVIVSVGYSSYTMYFGNVVTPRKILFDGGVEVFKDYFPFGSGFASYGSSAAYDFYSPLYLKLGFQHVWGLNRQYGLIANDNFWPMIFAQFGLIGSLLYILIFIGIIKDLFIKTNKKNEVISLALIIGYLLFTSVGSNTITGVLGVSMITVYALIVNTVSNS